jgi:hypothetical protein
MIVASALKHDCQREVPKPASGLLGPIATLSLADAMSQYLPQGNLSVHTPFQPVSSGPNANPPKTQLDLFDAQVESITKVRGGTYGHPADDFARVTRMASALPAFSDPRFAHIAYMICVKLARLSQSPEHVDSLIDIAGYARTWAMILERDYKPKANP